MKIEQIIEQKETIFHTYWFTYRNVNNVSTTRYQFNHSSRAYDNEEEAVDHNLTDNVEYVDINREKIPYTVGDFHVKEEPEEDQPDIVGTAEVGFVTKRELSKQELDAVARKLTDIVDEEYEDYMRDSAERKEWH